MPYTVANLLELLELERIEHNIYRGQNRDIGTERIYGGQVLAQSLVAAQRTVEGDRVAHSLHGYFILAGDLGVPVVYFVDRLRDGKSFNTRQVTAIQHGRAIFNMSASFHRHEEGLDHQQPMSDAPPPETLRPELDLIREHAAELPDEIRGVLTQDRPLDFRPVEPDSMLDPRPAEARQQYWVRTVGAMDDEVAHHQAVLAYASDYSLILTALRPHGVTARQPEVMVASLDHAIWFHRPFRVDDWLLYAIDSPSAAGARGFARATFHSRSGTLVASVAQEGVMRVRRERPTP